MNLSKAYDTLNHELLIAQLHAYGFDESLLKLLHNYLLNRWYRTEVNNKFSSWAELLKDVPQGSVLGPLLFIIYLINSFFLPEYTVCNFADDTTFYACDSDLKSLINGLELDSLLMIEWFENNNMKLNQDKCHVTDFEHKYENVFFLCQSVNNLGE